MHTGSVSESDGRFDDWKWSDQLCRKCGCERVRFRVWESNCGGYEDLKYRCDGCGETWWVDGPDA